MALSPPPHFASTPLPTTLAPGASLSGYIPDDTLTEWAKDFHVFKGKYARAREPRDWRSHLGRARRVRIGTRSQRSISFRGPPFRHPPRIDGPLNEGGTGIFHDRREHRVARPALPAARDVAHHDGAAVASGLFADGMVGHRASVAEVALRAVNPSTSRSWLLGGAVIAAAPPAGIAERIGPRNLVPR